MIHQGASLLTNSPFIIQVVTLQKSPRDPNSFFCSLLTLLKIAYVMCGQRTQDYQEIKQALPQIATRPLPQQFKGDPKSL